jgi:hypothetical protein
VADILLPRLRTIRLGGSSDVGPSPGRCDLKPHSVAVLPEVLAQRAVREARNADGGTGFLVKKKRESETNSKYDHDPHEYNDDKSIFFAHRLLYDSRPTASM